GNLTSAANAAWIAAGHSGPIVLEQGEMFSFNFTTLAALNVGTVVNTVTVSGHDDEDTPTSASDMATVIVTNVTPSITVDKTAPATVAEGSTVPYGFNITNTSPARPDPVPIPCTTLFRPGNLTSAANAAWIAAGHSGPIVLQQGQMFSFNFTS